MKKKNIIKVQEVTKADYDLRFSEFYYSLFLASELIESIDKKYSKHYLNLLRNEEVVAKISGISIQGSNLSGRYLYFFAAPALIEESEDLFNECLEALRKFARKSRYSRIYIQSYDQQHQWRCKAKGYYPRTILEFVRYFNYDGNPPSFSKSLMYNVRKAGKLNPVFKEESSPRILQKLHELLQVTHQIRNEKFNGEYYPYPYNYIDKDAIDKLFYSGFLRLYHLEVDGVIHCVRCALVKDKRMYGLMIASDEFAYKNGLQHYLQHQLMTRLFEQQYKYYNIALMDFAQKGLISYKESLGCMRHKVHGAYTHFITFPQNMINPLMDFGRFVSKVGFLKKVIEFGSRIISGKDKW